MHAVDVVIAQAKRIYILIIKANKLFSFFSSWCFLKEIENMYSVFPVIQTLGESLGELEKAMETLAYGLCSHSISHSPKLPLVFVQLDRNTVHVFYFLNDVHVGLILLISYTSPCYNKTSSSSLLYSCCHCLCHYSHLCRH